MVLSVFSTEKLLVIERRLQMAKKTLEQMTTDQVRAANNLLGKDLDGRHVEAICKRGGASFHGKIHIIDERYYLEPKALHIVREAMEEEGFEKKPKFEGPCVWNQPRIQFEPKPAPAKIQAKPDKTPNLRLLRKQVSEGEFRSASAAVG